MPLQSEYLKHMKRLLLRSKNKNMKLSQLRNTIRWHFAFSSSRVPLSRVSSIRITKDNKAHDTFSFSENKTYSSTPDKIVQLDESRRFMFECFLAIGTPQKHAEAMADVLREADYLGHYSHGMNRLEQYLTDITRKVCDDKATPEVLKDSPGSAWVDGKNGLGAVVGNFCMKLAIEKAKKNGVGLVSAKNCNHFGISGWYLKLAIEQKLIGFCCTNATPMMVPTRAKKASLGTNPLAVGAPAEDNKSLYFDMATTAVAFGKIELKKRKQEPIPEGWALDNNGQITTNADIALKNKLLMPLGGAEENGGYKGFGLGLMVEMLCGILSDSKFGPNIRMWTGPNSPVAELGQCFMAINPESFAPGFEKRMKEFLNSMRSMEPANPKFPVLVPGDSERLHKEKVEKDGGVKYVSNQIETCNALAKKLSVTPLKTVN